MQKKVGLNWETVYTDADWETKFTWLERNVTSRDITLLDALFDVIAYASEQRFDWKLAMDMFNKGKFPTKEEIEAQG